MSLSLLYAMDTDTPQKSGTQLEKKLSLQEIQEIAQTKGKFFADGALVFLKTLRERQLDKRHSIDPDLWIEIKLLFYYTLLDKTTKSCDQNEIEGMMIQVKKKESLLLPPLEQLRQDTLLANLTCHQGEYDCRQKSRELLADKISKLEKDLSKLGITTPGVVRTKEITTRYLSEEEKAQLFADGCLLFMRQLLLKTHLSSETLQDSFYTTYLERFSTLTKGTLFLEKMIQQVANNKYIVQQTATVSESDKLLGLNTQRLLTEEEFKRFIMRLKDISNTKSIKIKQQIIEEHARTLHRISSSSNTSAEMPLLPERTSDELTTKKEPHVEPRLQRAQSTSHLDTGLRQQRRSLMSKYLFQSKSEDVKK